MFLFLLLKNGSQVEDFSKIRGGYVCSKTARCAQTRLALVFSAGELTFGLYINLTVLKWPKDGSIINFCRKTCSRRWASAVRPQLQHVAA